MDYQLREVMVVTPWGDQLVLIQSVGRRVFIDSDDLQNLDLLFDYVGNLPRCRFKLTGGPVWISCSVLARS